MKKIIPVVFLLLTNLLYSTTQFSEKVIYKDEKYSLNVHKNSAPLEYLFRHYNYKSPFRWTSTANYRGYIGTWIIKDSKLYLSKIVYRNSIEIPLKVIFHDYVKNDMVEAFWYTDQIIIKSSKDYNNYYFDILNGKVVKSITITDPELNSKEVNKLLNNIPTDKSGSKIKKDIRIFSDEEINKTAQYMERFYHERDKKAEDRKRLERIFEDKVAKKTYSKIDGYEAYSSKFNIERSKIYRKKNAVTEGATEAKELFMNIAVNNNYRIKWYLSVYDNKTTYNWYDLAIMFNEIESKLSSFNWLNRLINNDKDIVITIRIEEDVVSGSRDEKINQLWEKSNLHGKPLCSIELENNKYRSEVAISKDEKKAIMYYCFNKYQYKPLKEYKSFRDIIKGKNISWFKNFDFRYRPTNNHYLIVSDNGGFTVSNDWVIEKESDSLLLYLD